MASVPELIFWLLMLVIVPVLIFLIWRNLKKLPYKFDMVFMTPGINDHQNVDGEKLDFKHKDHEIKAERLYRLKPGALRKIWFKLRGIKESFIVVFQYEQTEPIAPVEVAASARMIKVVSESRALDKALRSEFSVPWDLKKILMVIGFLVIAVVVWFLISGDVVL